MLRHTPFAYEAKGLVSTALVDLRRRGRVGRREGFHPSDRDAERERDRDHDAEKEDRRVREEPGDTVSQAAGQRLRDELHLALVSRADEKFPPARRRRRLCSRSIAS